jgi:hypothetical protein
LKAFQTRPIVDFDKPERFAIDALVPVEVDGRAVVDFPGPGYRLVGKADAEAPTPGRGVESCA